MNRVDCADNDAADAGLAQHKFQCQFVSSRLMRNVAAVGATPHAVSDCLCFGNPEKPHQMWEFVESVRGIADACHTIALKDNPHDATPIIA